MENGEVGTMTSERTCMIFEKPSQFLGCLMWHQCC